jgi:predicted PurR-regulated permease PerM
VNRTLAIVFVFVVLAAGIGFGFVLAVPAVIGQARDLVTVTAGDEFDDANKNDMYDAGEKVVLDRNQDGVYTPPLIHKFTAWLTAFALDITDRFTQSAKVRDSVRNSLARIETYYKAATDNLLTDFGGYTLSLVRSTTAFMIYLVGFMLMPFYVFFFLRGWEDLKRRATGLLPGRSRDRIVRIVYKIDRAMAGFFRGRLIVCSLCSLITWIGLWIIGVPYAFLFGLLIGTATVIPFLGLVFLVPAVLVVYLSPGGTVADVTWTVVLYGCVQILQGFILDPIVMGKEAQLHPVALVLAFLICGEILGVIGVIMAVPIASVAKILIGEFVMPSVEALAAEEPSTIIPRELVPPELRRPPSRGQGA